MSLIDWSETAANNDDADATINWLEGQAPSTVNGSARAMMAVLKKAIGNVYSVKDYGGATGDGVTDDTTSINNTISAASTLGTSTGSQIRVAFPDGTYLCDAIMIKKNVWLDLGGATIKKRSDSSDSTNNCMIRALETLSGSTYYGTYSNIKITGGYLDGNGKTATAQMTRLLYIDGLELDGITVTSYCPGAWAFLVGGRNGIVRNCKTQGVDALFEDGIHLFHGQYWRIIGNDLASGDDAIAIGGEISDAFLAADPDSIRYVTVQGNTVEAEKGAALKITVPNTATGTNWEVSDIVVDGLTGKSGITRNGGIVVEDLNGSAAGTSQIRRVSIKNAAIDVGSTTHDETNSYGMRIASVIDVSVDATLKCTEKSAASTGFDIVIVRNSEDVKLRVRYHEQQTRFAFDVRDSNRVTLNECRGKQQSGTAQPVMFFDDLTDFKVANCNFTDIKSGNSAFNCSTGTTSTGELIGNTFSHASGATSGNALALSGSALLHLALIGNDFSGAFAPVSMSSLAGVPSLIVRGNRGLSYERAKCRFFDDFNGDVLADQWNSRTGTDGQVVAPAISAAAGGMMRMTTGDDAAADMATNGVQLESALNWQADQGNLIFEAKIRVNAITSVCLFAGFTSSASLQMPFTLAAGDTLTSNAVDAVGVLFDTAADTDNWWLVGVANNSDSTKQNAAVAPSALAYETWRIELTPAGAAQFYRNGAKVGTSMSGAVTATVALTPIIAAFSRTSTSRNVDADFILCEQNRA